MDRIREVARVSKEQAYAPYSEFRVGACLRTEEGYFNGTNIELSGRRGVHAEQMAVYKAVMMGSQEFRALAVSCTGQNGDCPCGICLHTIGEFCDDVNIYLDQGDEWVKTALSKELPNAYRRGGGNSRHD